MHIIGSHSSPNKKSLRQSIYQLKMVCARDVNGHELIATLWWASVLNWFVVSNIVRFLFQAVPLILIHKYHGCISKMEKKTTKKCPKIEISSIHTLSCVRWSCRAQLRVIYHHLTVIHHLWLSISFWNEFHVLTVPGSRWPPLNCDQTFSHSNGTSNANGNNEREKRKESSFIWVWVQHKNANE